MLRIGFKRDHLKASKRLKAFQDEWKKNSVELIESGKYHHYNVWKDPVIHQRKRRAHHLPPLDMKE